MAIIGTCWKTSSWFDNKWRAGTWASDSVVQSALTLLTNFRQSGT